jgi:hypothetical protein
VPDRFRLCLFLGLILSASQALVAHAHVDRDPCPSPGTVAVRDDGQRLVFAGEDPDEVALCLVRIGEQTRRLLFGFWAPIGPDMQEPRSALGRLLAGGPGTRVTIREHVFTDSWVETWERGGEETVPLRSGPRRAVRFDRTMRLSGPTGFHARATYWIDAETGVVLKATHQHLEGLRLPYRDIAITHLDTRG